MATLADSFLADLDELSANVLHDENLDVELEVVGDLAHTLDNVSKLQNSRRYIDVMQKVEEALIQNKYPDVVTNKGNSVVLEDDDPEFQFIVACNTLLIDIENEIFIIQNFIHDRYRLKFPELNSLARDPIDYAWVVKQIGNEMDVTRVDLKGPLTSEVNIMAVCVAASTTNGKPLPEDVLQKTLEACDRAIALDSAKKKVLDFLESRMGYIAPNLSAVVGSAVGAKLIGAAGGISKLANRPSDNIQHLGDKRKNLAGFSSKFCRVGGYIEQSEIIQKTPPSLRKKACGWLADKSILAARMDSNRGMPTGDYGKSLKEEILKKIEKSQERPPARLPNSLPVPRDTNPKNKRGGGRDRKRKERYEMTVTRKLANRVQFGVPEESSLGDGVGVGYGMLGQAGSGKLRVSVKVAKKKFKSSSTGAATISGLTSCLAFTPVQGIELSNPANQLDSGTQSTYFSETGRFSKINKCLIC